MGQFADSSWAVLMLPPVLHRGEKHFQKASGLEIPTFFPAGMCRRVLERLPRASCRISSPNPGLALHLLLPPTLCQLKSFLSLDSPQVILSMAQPECVPALFSSFSRIFSSLLLMLSLVSHPLCLFREELLGAVVPQEAGAGEIPKGSSRAVLGMKSLKTPQGCSVQPGDLSHRGAVEGHPARSRHISGAVP